MSALVLATVAVSAASAAQASKEGDPVTVATVGEPPAVTPSPMLHKNQQKKGDGDAAMRWGGQLAD